MDGSSLSQRREISQKELAIKSPEKETKWFCWIKYQTKGKIYNSMVAEIQISDKLCTFLGTCYTREIMSSDSTSIFRSNSAKLSPCAKLAMRQFRLKWKPQSIKKKKMKSLNSSAMFFNSAALASLTCWLCFIVYRVSLSYELPWKGKN